MNYTVAITKDLKTGKSTAAVHKANCQHLGRRNVTRIFDKATLEGNVQPLANCVKAAA